MLKLKERKKEDIFKRELGRRKFNRKRHCSRKNKMAKNRKRNKRDEIRSIGRILEDRCPFDV